MDLNKKLNCYLKIERELVGVKILKDKKEYDSIEIKEATNKAQYCVMVKSATLGHSIKVASNKFKCQAGGRAVGVIKPDDEYFSGEDYQKFGLYQDLDICRESLKKIDLNIGDNYGVAIGPLSKIDFVPDVIIIVTTPYNIMRLAQSYTYTSGIKSDYKISGNQAICAECTSTPLINKGINISGLCAGTRYAAKWSDDEMAIGINYSIFPELVESVEKTINKIEPDNKKREIIERLEKESLDSSFITLGTSYFLD